VQGAFLKRRDFLAASSLPWALMGCDKPLAIQGGFVGAAHERGHLLRQPQLQRTPSKTIRTRVLIAGGGVAGLAAARAMRLRGMNDFALLELESSAGGNSRGGAVNGIACPLGAHYLPVPKASGDSPVRDLLEELGLRQRIAGRWQYDERALCHSPQERLFINEQWQDGLLPLHEVDAKTLAEYKSFARLVNAASNAAPFVIPVANMPVAQYQLALDAITFESWLDQQQLTSLPLRWYLDYCCRDDYGAGISVVSAWAGIHYFASRHGFSSPGSDAAQDREAGVLTWPQGNGWLTQKLAAPLGERLHTGQVVTRITSAKHGVEVDALDVASGQLVRWQAERCIVALPLFVAARVISNPPPALLQAAASARYAPWLVANIHINAALHDRPGAAPSWDNVLYSAEDSVSRANAEGLGYVDAKHQSLARVPGATVLTHYRAFGIQASRRKHLYDQPWAHWRDMVLAELSAAHPDLPAKTTRIDIMRYGHAMSVPVPGVRSSAALAALQRQHTTHPRLQFAHSDLSGYSVFEEAFTHGHLQGSRV
jgi:predicted NAD/FAD-dependent oxidoreductase